ncbi:MAG: glycosyltransferase family 25 protein [Prevotella sp.]|nr:glycosyltransferase family 25 protein [Bacteroides sp.]MCM1365903.1 glycosyltransferase family 25 protein [Prevotella sp.]
MRKGNRCSFDVPGGIFVAHVRTGYEDRARHIEAMLHGFGVEFEYMLDGDITDFTENVLSANFSVDNDMTPAALSCALKHILICRQVISRNLDGALVLEDDICLNKKFPTIFEKSMRELAVLHNSNPETAYLINYEDTRLRFVPHSKRIHGQVLYRGDRDRMTGCYYIDKNAARILIDEVDSRRMHKPIDHFHRYLLDSGLIQYLWCQPTIATQGSHNGLFHSAINTTKARREEYLWRLKLCYKKLLYRLR